MGLETRTTKKTLGPRLADDLLSSPGRPSSEDILGISGDVVHHATAPHEERDPPSFMPTRGMVEAKATFWAMAAADPTIMPERVTRDQVKLILGDKRLDNWYKKPGFFKWFLNRHEHESMVIALYDEWLRQVAERQSGMADKDLIALGKLLDTAKNRILDTKQLESAKGVEGMNQDALIQYLLTTAQSLGWEVSIPPGAPGHGLLAAESTKGDADAIDVETTVHEEQ